MSGLVGISLRDGPPREEALQRMFDVSPHRGRRQQIRAHGMTAVGISDDAALPEASIARDDTLLVAFCGVLDNLASLRSELASHGFEPRDTSEAATVAAGWRCFGSTLCERLRGTYTVLVSDGRRLACFRDHFGFRTLFYHRDDRQVVVGTEVKQVAAGAGFDLRADPAEVERIFYGIDDDNATAVKGVLRLPKASLLRADPEGVDVQRYWYPERLVESAEPSAHEIQESFDLLMDQAVRRCLTGDDVISLSGGVDSPIVAGFAAPAHRELTGRPLPALSIVAPQYPSVDESEYIREVVDFLGIDPWHTYEQSVPPVEGLSRWVELCDGAVPTVTLNEIEQHYREARQGGYRNVLTGEFAEFVVDRPDGLLVHLLRNRRWGPLHDQIRLHRARGRSRARVARELAGIVLPRAVVVHHRRRSQEFAFRRPPWLDADRAASGWGQRVVEPRNRWRRSQTNVFFGTGISQEAAELIQTLVGVRVRRPWLDVDLWEFFLSLPAETKYNGTLRKPLVRELARGRVPDRILDRRDKTVFNESMQARLDYDELKRWLIDPSGAMPGVDYALLRHRLEHQELDLVEYRWARDLAAAHAFLELHGG